MKATIEGVEVEGTPEEIAALIKCLRPAEVAGEKKPKPKVGRELTHEEQREHDRIVKLLDGLRTRTPNFNITPLAHLCTGGMRFC